MESNQEIVLVLASHDESLTSEMTTVTGGAMLATAELNRLSPLIAEHQPAVVLIDQRFSIDGGHAVDQVVEQIQLSYPDVAVSVLTTDVVPEVLERRAACSAMQLARSSNLEALHEHVQRLLPAHATNRLTDQSGLPSETVRETPARESFGEAIFEGITRRFETRSPELKQVLDDLMIAASHNVTILLIGETGSGKTFLSSLIHESSPRRAEPFLHVACGALPRELIESELFGHVKGAFTSAHTDKEGKFIAARKGTILLDEIDVLGPEQQVKLLRVIETGEFEPVGSNMTLKSQARLVVASNLDLQPLVEQGKFRPDLYYRLSMLKFEIPPLRRRKMDIIPLAKKFITQFQEKHGIPVNRIEDAFLDGLLGYPWPGNVRELEHVIQRAVIYCRDGVLTASQLPPNILSGQVGPTNDPSVQLGNKSILARGETLERQVALSEKEIIEEALFKNNFSRTKTAKDLGISRVTLYNKMKKYDMLK